MKIINTIFNNIQLAGSYLILLGLIRLYAYYSKFNVNILNYLDFSEFITSFFNVGFIVIMCLILILISYIIIIITRKKRIKTVPFWIVFLLTTFISFFPSLFFAIKLNNVQDFFPHINACMGFACLQVICLFFLKKQKVDPAIIMIVAMMILLLILDYNFNKAQAIVTKTKAPTQGAIYVSNLSDSIIICDTVNIYVGKTKNYLFIYKSVDCLTRIIDMKNVKQIDIRQNGESIISNNYW